MRSGSSQRGHSRFVRETLARVRRLGADAAVTVRADSGFFSYEMLDAIEDHRARYSITVAQDAPERAGPPPHTNPAPTNLTQAPFTNPSVDPGLEAAPMLVSWAER